LNKRLDSECEGQLLDSIRIDDILSLVDGPRPAVEGWTRPEPLGRERIRPALVSKAANQRSRRNDSSRAIAWLSLPSRDEEGNGRWTW
jgi:ribonuclease PH